MTTMACMTYQKSFKMGADTNVSNFSKNVQESIGQGWVLLSECAIWNSEARIEIPEDTKQGFTGTATKKFEY